MATFATVPLDFITGGWLDQVSEAGFKVFVKCLALPLREPRTIRHCCVHLSLKRGDWLMSRNKMKESVGIANDRTFERAVQELGPAGVGFLAWRPTCEHRGPKEKKVWSITRPDLFVRTAEDVEAEKRSGTGLSGWQPLATNPAVEMVANGNQYRREPGNQRPPLHTRARRGSGAGEGKGRAAAHAHDLREDQPGSLAPSLSEAADFSSFLDAAAERKRNPLDVSPEEMEERRDRVMEQLFAVAAAHGEIIPERLKRGRNGAAT